MSPTAVSAPTAEQVIERAKEVGAKMVDFRFTDLPGTWQHFSVPVGELTESVFTDGIGFDGSSIRGFQKIHESDMLLFPDPARAFLDPVLEVPTLVVVCDVVDPLTLKPYSRDPRYVARKAEEYLRQSGIAETSYWGPEAEFYIFNSIRYDQNSHEGYYYIDSDEGVWNTGKNGTANLGYRPKFKGGYFPVPPVDKQQDLRSRIVLALIESGIDIEVHHHEVGTAGQAEIDMRFDTLVSIRPTRFCSTSTSSRACAIARGTPPPSCPSRSSVTTAAGCTHISPCGTATLRSSTTPPGTRCSATPPAGTSGDS